MANVFAIHSVCRSIASFLQDTYPASSGGRAMPVCRFEVLASGQMAGTLGDTDRISLLLYRVAVNEHRRDLRPGGSPHSGSQPLDLDLHILLSVWSGNAMSEQVILAWAMRQLHLHPLLNASSLSPEADWDSDEVIQIVPSELCTEDMMRLWGALVLPYRLSVSYVARVVRLSGPSQPGGDAKADGTDHRTE